MNNKHHEIWQAAWVATRVEYPEAKNCFLTLYEVPKLALSLYKRFSRGMICYSISTSQLTCSSRTSFALKSRQSDNVWSDLWEDSLDFDLSCNGRIPSEPSPSGIDGSLFPANQKESQLPVPNQNIIQSHFKNAWH